MYVGCLLSPGVADGLVIHRLLVKQNICQYETCGRVEPAEIERIPYQVVETERVPLLSYLLLSAQNVKSVTREKKVTSITKNLLYNPRRALGSGATLNPHLGFILKDEELVGG